MLTINHRCKVSGPDTKASNGTAEFVLIRLRIEDAPIDDGHPLARFTKHGVGYALSNTAKEWERSGSYKSDHDKPTICPAAIPPGYELDESGYARVACADLEGLLPAKERGGTKAVKADTILKAIESGRMSADEIAALKAALADG